VAISFEANDLSLLLLREDIGEVYDGVVRAAAAAVGAETCHLALYDPERREFLSRRARTAAVSEAPAQFRFPEDTSPASAQVIRTRVPHVSNDPAQDPLYGPSYAEQGLRSVLTVPICREDQALGLIYAMNKPGGFTHDDAQVLLGVAAALAIVLESAQLHADERDRRVYHESLLEGTRALVTNPNEDSALGVVLDQLWRVMSYQAAAVLMLESGHLRVAASRGGEPGLEIPLQRAAAVNAIIETLNVDTLADPAWVMEHLGFKIATNRVVVAPLVSKREILGAIVAAFDAEHASEAAAGEVIQGFASQAAIFLDLSRLLRRERQVRTRAASVARVTRKVATKVEQDSVIQAAVTEMLALSGADRCVLYLGHPRNPILIYEADAGTQPGERAHVRELRIDLSSSRLARLVEEREAVQLQGDGAPLPEDLTPFPDTRTLVFLPMVSRDVLMGAIVLASLRETRRFEAVQMEFLGDVAQQIGLAIENAKLFARVSYLAKTDELTQLPNRRRFMEAFEASLAEARRSGTPLALVLADVDRLKRINDTFGHPAGDAAIRHVAATLQAGRREGELPARLGGEEFAIVLPGADILLGAKLADEICNRLIHSEVEGVGRVTASFGVAAFPEDARQDKDLFAVADRRLYTAKTSGRSQVCYVTVESSPESPTRKLKAVKLAPDEP
jgi:diguanylate cyclase (GGDEF)-like protein